MLAKRIITGLILIIVSGFLVWLGVLPFALEIAVICILSLREFYKLFLSQPNNTAKPSIRSGIFWSLVWLTGCYFFSEYNSYSLFAGIMLTMLVVFLLRRKFETLRILDIGVTLFGFIYVTWFLSFMIFLRKIPGEFYIGSVSLHAGACYVFLLILITAMCDITSFFVGRYLGRVKLWPEISPGKTVEGALGGLAGSVLMAFIGGRLLGIDIIISISMGLILGILAQFGDLFESFIKREVGVKDSGNILTGHGGALDRFDSYFFTTPAMYLIVNLLLMKQ